MSIEKRFYTTKEVSEILGASYLTIYKKIRSGEIKAITLGRNYRVSDIELQYYINKNENGIDRDSIGDSDK